MENPLSLFLSIHIYDELQERCIIKVNPLLNSELETICRSFGVLEYLMGFELIRIFKTDFRKIVLIVLG